MSEQFRTPDRMTPNIINVLSRRRLMTAAGSLILAATGCSGSDTADGFATDKTPHDVYPAIAKGKIFPKDGAVAFDEGIAAYSPSVITNPADDIFKIDASCGNPIDKRDKEQNVYVYITTNGQTSITTSLKDFEPCKDGSLTPGELDQLQTEK